MIRWGQRAADTGLRRPASILAFAAGLSIATVALVWLAWTATAEMRRSTTLLLGRRASEVLAFTSAALDRDMKGAWLSVLVPLDADAIAENPPYDLLQQVSRTFARFPYPESFLVWTDNGEPGGRAYAFNRSDRPAPWDPQNQGTEPYPVTLIQAPGPLQPLIDRIRTGAVAHRRFALVETTIAGVPYQTIVHYLFESSPEERLAGFGAFTVNLDWVRREYLGDLLRQVATIDGGEDAMVVTVLDEQGQVVATSGGAGAAQPVRERTFPLLFLETAVLPSGPGPDPPIVRWTARVAPTERMAGAASALGTRLLLLSSLAGFASLAAVLLTVRTVRASAELAALKSEFVSTVTHELKTPLALIKLVGDTLARGRYSSPDTIRDYAGILVQEERRLSRLIENLLTYSRLSDLKQVYAFESVELSEIVEDALEPFRPRLTELGFELHLRVAPDLPPVRADRVALMQVFENIIDNAIKYSPGARRLDIDVRAEGDQVVVTFTDAGSGIADAELSRVFEKFYRGRTVTEAGSGLGLAIAQRILQQHGATAAIRSEVGVGTSVQVSIPAQRQA